MKMKVHNNKIKKISFGILNLKDQQTEVYRNFTISLNKHHIHIRPKLIENPCYSKDYFNATNNIKGTGNFTKCYDLLSKLVNSDKKYIASVKHNSISSNLKNEKDKEQSILLSSEFDTISEYFKVESITLLKLKEETEKVCSGSDKTLNNTDNMCFRLTYTIIILDNLLDNNNSINLLFSSKALYTNTNTPDSNNAEDKSGTANEENNNSLSENDLLINISHFQKYKLPKDLVITLIILLFLYIFTYFFKSHSSIFIEQTFFREQIEKGASSKNLSLLDTTITALPVKNFIFSFLIQEVKIYTQKEIFISLQEYKIFFYKMFKKYPQVREKVNETLIKRNRLKSSIIVSLFIIILTIIISVITTKIISYTTFEDKNFFRLLLVSFSFAYMSLLILESLKLITYIDNIKYLYSYNLSELEKQFLCEEYDNCQDLSNASSDYN